MRTADTGLFKDKYNLEIKDFIKIVSFAENFPKRSEQILKKYSDEGQFPDKILLNYLDTVSSMITARISNNSDTTWLTGHVRSFIDNKTDFFLQTNCSAESFFKDGFREECFLYIVFDIKNKPDIYNLNKPIKKGVQPLSEQAGGQPNPEGPETLLEQNTDNIQEQPKDKVQDKKTRLHTSKSDKRPDIQLKETARYSQSQPEADFSLPFKDFIENTDFSSELIAQKKILVMSEAAECFSDKRIADDFMSELADCALFLYNNTPTWFGLTASDMCPVIYEAVNNYILQNKGNKNLLGEQFFNNCTLLVFNFMQKRQDITSQKVQQNNVSEEDLTDLEWEEFTERHKELHAYVHDTDNDVFITESEYQERRNYLATVISSITLNWELTQNFMAGLDDIAMETVQGISRILPDELSDHISARIDTYLKRFIESNKVEGVLPDNFHSDCTKLAVYKLRMKIHENESFETKVPTGKFDIIAPIQSLYSGKNDEENNEFGEKTGEDNNTGIDEALPEHLPEESAEPLNETAVKEEVCEQTEPGQNYEKPEIIIRDEAIMPEVDAKDDRNDEHTENVIDETDTAEVILQEESRDNVQQDEYTVPEPDTTAENEVSENKSGRIQVPDTEDMPATGETANADNLPLEPNESTGLFHDKFDLSLTDFLDSADFGDNFSDNAMKSVKMYSKSSRISPEEIINRLDSVADSLVNDITQNNKQWEVSDIWQYIENHSRLLLTNEHITEDSEKNGFYEACFAYVIYLIKIKTGELNTYSIDTDFQSISGEPYGQYISKMPEASRNDMDKLIKELIKKETLLNKDFDREHFVAYMDSLIPNIERVLDYPVYKISDVLQYINTSLENYKKEGVNKCTGHVPIIFGYVSLALKRILQQTGNGTTEGREQYYEPDNGTGFGTVDDEATKLHLKEEKKYRTASRILYVIVAFIILVLLILFIGTIPEWGGKFLTLHETGNRSIYYFIFSYSQLNL